VQKIGAAIGSGDWNQALWDLRVVLDKVLSVLKVVLLVVTLIGTVVSLGALAPVLALTVLALSAVKFEVTARQFSTSSMNKETGQTLGVHDLLFDGVDVALASLAFAGAVSNFQKGTVVFGKGLDGYNAGRQFLSDETGVALKNGYNVSLKQTIAATRKIVLEGDDVLTATGHDGLLADPGIRQTVGGLGGDGNWWSGTPAHDARYDAIDGELANIRHGNRGIADPTQTILIDGGW
jgi:hypothetical protein